MIGRSYSVVAPLVAATVATDLLEINVASTCALIITGLFIGQNTDEGDAQAEALKLQIIKGYTTSGSGGSTPTPGKVGGTGLPAAASTFEANNTTGASAGSPVTLHEDAINIQIGYQLRLTPEEYIVLAPSERCVIRISAPADSITVGATLYFQEIG